jgi:hypothetical protein
MTALKPWVSQAAQIWNGRLPPLTDFGYALSSSAFYEYMTQIVHPILRWYPASL